MYELNIFTQASTLESLLAHWPVARAQQPNTKPRRRLRYWRLPFAGLANLANMRVMAGPALGTARLHDPRDPQNW
jgi:hypothetical protein